MNLKRRDFISFLGGAAAGWPLAARAQQTARVRRIGILSSTASDALGQTRTRVFQQELERLGWTDGRNLVIEYRWGDGRTERYPELAAELVRLGVDVIVTDSTPSALAAKQATSVIPIVIAAGDPVATGLVASLARPGGNITGLSSQTTDLAGKRLELLREIVPGLHRVGILINVTNITAVVEVRGLEAAAAVLGVDVAKLEIREAADIAPAIQGFTGPALALYIPLDALAVSYALRINTLALGQHLPTMHDTREQLQAGGLMSYGPDLLDARKRVAGYVNKILRGAKPADLPVEQPTKFELVINLTTAKALGLTIPEAFLARADEVIE
jgi:putative ABC transport system substrate-binding protein